MSDARDGVALLLPHGPAAVFVDGWLPASGDTLRCAGRVPADHALVRDGRAPSFACIELAAQGAALGVGRDAKRGGAEPDGAPRKPAPGFVVRLRVPRLRRRWVAPAAPLVAELRPGGGAGGVAIYAFTVFEDDDRLAEGTLTMRIEG